MAPRYTRWETVDIPEFHGGISSDSLLYWFEEVEEILEFQNVSEKRLISFVVKKFRGQAESWWRRVKTTRERAGKSPIKSWDKLKQKLCATFLPHHIMYKRLPNSKQGAQVVDNYTEKRRVQSKDFVNESIYDIDGDGLSTMKLASDGDSIPDVIEDKDEDVMDLEDNDVVIGVENGDEFVNTSNQNDDVDVADRVGHDDQIQDIDISLDIANVDDRVDSVKLKTMEFGSVGDVKTTDVTNVEDQIDNVKTSLEVTNVDVFDSIYDGGEVDIQHIELIETKRVLYKHLSLPKLGHVINNFDIFTTVICWSDVACEPRKYKAAHIRRRDLVFEPGDNSVKGTEDLVVTRVQGSLEATIVLIDTLNGGSSSKLHLRWKKECHEARKRKHYELVEKGVFNVKHYGSDLWANKCCNEEDNNLEEGPKILFDFKELSSDGYLHDSPPMRDKVDVVRYQERKSRTGFFELEETDAGGVSDIF